MAKAPHPLDVIQRPLITEKATRLGSEGKYAFEVLLHVNKVQIKEAVEKAFDVRVAEELWGEKRAVATPVAESAPKRRRPAKEKAPVAETPAETKPRRRTRKAAADEGEA